MFHSYFQIQINITINVRLYYIKNFPDIFLKCFTEIHILIFHANVKLFQNIQSMLQPISLVVKD